MSRLREPLVKLTAVEYLKKEYSAEYKLESIYSKIEAQTTPKFNGIADGFLCFNSSKQINHTVSIEAKSHKTLINLKPYLDADRYISHIGIFSAIIAIVPIYYLPSFSWYWMALLFVVITIVTFLIFAYISHQLILEPKRYQTADVLKQVNRYPANEKWIAISRDSVNLLKNRKPYLNGCNYENLMSICNRHGIGVIVINKVEPKILLRPTFRKGKFLSCYKLPNDTKILNAL